MSLTKNDLQAIKQLIDNSIDERVPAIIDERVQPMLDGLEQRLVKRIDDLDNTLSRQMEHGLQEVRDQIQEVDTRLSDELASVKQTVERIERTQQAEIERADKQDSTIRKIRKTLQAV